MKLYVNDIFVFSNSCDEIESLKPLLAKTIKMKDLGKATHCLVIHIIRYSETCVMKLTQKDYVNKMVKFNIPN